MKYITLASTEKWAREYVSDPPLLIITLTAANHPESPLRFTPDVVGVTSNDNKYESFAMQLRLPDDGERGTPRAQLTLSNADKTRLMPYLIGHELADAAIQFQMVRRSAPRCA